jgi:hypothetical protein
MAEVGTKIENPTTGEKITWVETAATTDGSLLSFDLELRSDRRGRRTSTRRADRGLSGAVGKDRDKCRWR